MHPGGNGSLINRFQLGLTMKLRAANSEADAAAAAVLLPGST